MLKSFIIKVVKDLSKLSILYFVLMSCNSVDPTEFGYGDDYLIYSKVLNETITEKDILIVLQDSTRQESSIQNNFQYYLEHFPEADSATLGNYVRVNQTKVKLKKIPGLNFVFRSEYDKSQSKTVNVDLSNIGYNSVRTEAFVSMGALYGPLAGSGALLFLVKINNQWIIKKSVITWIS